MKPVVIYFIKVVNINFTGHLKRSNSFLVLFTVCFNSRLFLGPKAMILYILEYSIVIYPNSVTTLRLARFDGRIEFQGPFLKNLAPRSLPKMSATFTRGPNLKWQPGSTKMSIKE